MTRRYGGNTRLNNTFNDMKQRCYNPQNKNYKEYGGRGITICDEWLDKEVVHYPATKGWLAFEKWALSNGYTDNLTIDRIDVNKGYSPENCRWVTMKVQGNNRRTTRQIFYKGKIQSLKQWCNDLGFNRQTIEYRINKMGWSVERAFETKNNEHYTMITYKNRTQSVADWCRELGLPYQKTICRIKVYNWSIERAFTTK